jgi:cell fate (sporulation/competence/biofilm development) regulator YlbF (YheA/YmcA/DUF963 family)
MPTHSLWEEFRQLQKQHQDKLYEDARKGMTISERRKADQLEQALKPHDKYEDLVEKAKLIMPQIVNHKAWSDQGRINMPEIMKLLKVPQGTAYRLRKDVLAEWHKRDAERESQYTTEQDTPSNAPQEGTAE